MSWFVLALIAPFIWACVNLIDDHLLRNVYRSATFGAAISGVFGFLPAAALMMFGHIYLLDTKLNIVALSAGLLTVLFYFFYFKTLDNDEPSIAIGLNNVAPAIVPFLAFVILHETLYTIQYFGLGLLVISSFVLATSDLKRLRVTKSMWFGLCGALAYAAVSILAKYAYDRASFTSVYAVISLGFGLGGLIAFVVLTDKTQATTLFQGKKRQLVLILLGVEALNAFGEFIQGLAISGGPVSIVRGLESIQPLYVLIIGVVLAQILPQYVRERRDERFSRKIACMILMVIGLFMI